MWHRRGNPWRLLALSLEEGSLRALPGLWDDGEPMTGAARPPGEVGFRSEKQAGPTGVHLQRGALSALRPMDSPCPWALPAGPPPRHAGAEGGVRLVVLRLTAKAGVQASLSSVAPRPLLAPPHRPLCMGCNLALLLSACLTGWARDASATGVPG